MWNSTCRTRKQAAQLTKEQIILTVKKKRECKARLDEIIKVLIEIGTTPSDFLNMLKDISQCHYDDIVEERFIQKICGYPVCGNILTDIPNQKYQISTIANKVYDTTQRRKFCGPKCFKGSEYIRAQLLTSPLWLRDGEEIPTFTLLDDV